jgi:hypothetical protein
MPMPLANIGVLNIESATSLSITNYLIGHNVSLSASDISINSSQAFMLSRFVAEANVLEISAQTSIVVSSDEPGPGLSYSSPSPL